MKEFQESPLRKLARNNYYQNLYSMAKELGNIKFFDNEKDFTEIQISFLSWMNVYNSLFIDLGSGEENISEEIIKDSIRVDAYLLWRRHKRENSGDKHKNKEIKDNISGIPSIRFKRKR